MKLGTFVIAAGALALGLATWTTPAKAQGPLYDRVNVTLPYSVTIGERTLQPGDYVIQQLSGPSDSRVLLIYSDKGMKFETMAMTIPALDPATPGDTKVMLHHFGSDYYFDKIWIAGKNYGYEFPMPNSVKQRQREQMEPVSVAATYQSVPQPEITATAQDPQPAPEVRVPPAREAEPTPAPVASEPSTQTAQSTPAPAPQTGTADRAVEEPQQTPAMPQTSAGWLMLALGGTALSGAGLILRRKQ